MTEYDLEYMGVKCTGVEQNEYTFHFEYLGKEYVFEQEIEVESSADTDHIRIVIKEQFLPFVKEFLKMEQVQKETAKDILQPLYELCREHGQIQWDDIWFLVKRYGVEIED